MVTFSPLKSAHYVVRWWSKYLADLPCNPATNCCGGWRRWSGRWRWRASRARRLLRRRSAPQASRRRPLRLWQSPDRPTVRWPRYGPTATTAERNRTMYNFRQQMRLAFSIVQCTLLVKRWLNNQSDVVFEKTHVLLKVTIFLQATVQGKELGSQMWRT